jgi:hypothetical protein
MKIDQSRQEITIGDQTYHMQLGAGAGLAPQVGTRVTAYYKQVGGQRIITRIGQTEK